MEMTKTQKSLIFLFFQENKQYSFRVSEVHEILNFPKPSINRNLQELLKENKIVKVGRGLFAVSLDKFYRKIVKGSVYCTGKYMKKEASEKMVSDYFGP